MKGARKLKRVLQKLTARRKKFLKLKVEEKRQMKKKLLNLQTIRVKRLAGEEEVKARKK